MTNHSKYTITRSRRQAATETDGETQAVTVELPSGRSVSFDAYGPRLTFGSSLTDAGVNWSGIGTASLDDTLAFAQALSDMATMASFLAGPKS